MTPNGLEPVVAAIVARHRASGRTTIVGLAGGVAAGKSTIANGIGRAVADDHDLTVAVVSTDGFLFPNSRLASMGIGERKGFPESYDTDAVHRFLDAVLAGTTTTVPVYDHHSYDIVDAVTTVDPADVVVLEGVNALGFRDRLDLSIYLHADEPHLQAWFTARAFDLRDAARTEYSPFFDRWVDASDDDFRGMTVVAWELVNRPNLVEHIEPHRAAADIVIVKSADHTIESVEFRTVDEEANHGRG